MFKKKTLFVLAFLLLVLVVSFIKFKPSLAPTGFISNKSGQESEQSFNKSRFSIDDPKSSWVVVNKTRPLSPKTFAPSNLIVPKVTLRSSGMQLEKSAGRALEAMFKAAKKDSVNLMLASAYRSYSTQVSVYSNEVKQFGQKTADTQSARPGYSEHQTGLAADVAPASGNCVIDDCFGQTKEGKWIAANAYKYGFIIRYPENKQLITGYRPEPWHIRFIGTELSQEMKNQNILTLEEFFGLPAAPDYL